MFDIGWSELVVIAVVALIAIGPKELPGVLRTLGQWMAKIRQMASEFQSQFQEAMREAEMADLKKHAADLNDAASALTKPFEAADYLGTLDTTPPAADAATTAAASGEAAPSEAPAAAIAEETASPPAPGSAAPGDAGESAPAPPDAPAKGAA